MNVGPTMRTRVGPDDEVFKTNNENCGGKNVTYHLKTHHCSLNSSADANFIRHLHKDNDI